MILEFFWTLNVFVLSYLFAGLLLWVIPHDSGVGYMSCAFEDYNFLFIFFWFPMLFNEKIEKAISK